MTNEKLQTLANGKTLKALDFETAPKVFIGLNTLYTDAAFGRQQNSAIASELLYYGTLTAVLGVTLDSRAARNTGAAVAAIGDIFNSHYKTPDQQAAFQKAAARVRCGQEAIMPLSKEAFAMFGPDDLKDIDPPPTDEQKATGVTDAQTAVDGFPEHTQHFVDQVQDDLTKALSGIALTTDKDALTKTVNTYNAARNATPPENTPAQKETKKAEQAVADAKGDAATSQQTLSRMVGAGRDRTAIASLTTQLDSQNKKVEDAEAELARVKQKEAHNAQVQHAFVMALYAYKPALDICLKLPQ